MEKRIKMNSSSLQERFPEVYKDLFSKCDVVASASGSFCFAGEYDVLYGGIGVLQKIPLKVYVGLEQTNDGEIKDAGGVFFAPSKQSFEGFRTIISSNKNNKLNELFKNELDNLSEKGNKNGVKFYYIFEEPPSSGMNSSAAFSSSLALALFIISKKINPNDIKYWKGKKASELSDDQIFNKVFRLALKIESIIHEGTSSGASIFASMVDSFYPVIYFSEKRFGTERAEGKARLPVVVDREFEVYDKLAYKGIKFDEILKISSEWPIDFGLISSGDFIRSSFVVKSTEASKNFLNKARDFTKEALGEHLKFLPDTMIHDVIRKPQELWLNFVRAVNSTAILTFFNLYYIFKFGVSNSNVQDLTDSINANHDALSLIGLSSEKLDNICNKISEGALHTNNQVGCKIAGAGKKGSVLFVTVFDGLRDSIGKIIDNISKDYEEEVFLDYASWIDGVGGEEIKIEQSLSSGIYSDFVSSGLLKTRYLDKKGNLNQKFFTREEFEERKNKIDLVIDLIEGGIYIKGKRLTSKDIFSSSETSNILELLIDNIGEPVSNHKLPHSSYAMERGEMQSKIISPFAKSIKKYLDKKISLSISGSSLDFVLILKPGLEIILLDKIF